MSSQLFGQLEQRMEQSRRLERRPLRVFTIEALGPLTMLAGIVWAIAQPYRIVFFDPEGKGFYDYLIQPPLLVCLVGLIFALALAPGLVEDIRATAGREADGGDDSPR